MLRIPLVLLVLFNFSYAVNIDKKYIRDVKRCEKLYYSALSHTITSDISSNYANMYLACVKKAEVDLILRLYKKGLKF